MPLAPGTTLGRYEVSELLGEGGMGAVYRARDRRLDRDVALKVIADRIAGDATARARFEREARAVAALSHPNILAIFDFSKDHDLWFTVTELLEGETLRDHLSRGGMTPAETLAIASDVAAGLSAAHERDIVHRDLKPENIFITRSGVVKILDFGLAVMPKPAVASDDTEAMTTEGVVVGTIAYMSPEQLRGETLTAASDVFAFGSVFYECIARRRPFAGGSNAATVAAILTQDPPALNGSPELQAIVMRCLQKDPAARFASGRELGAALKKPAAEPDVPRATRVMVLPFRMLRRDDDLDFLSYSLSDAIVGSLAGINSLVVRSSLAASQYGTAPVDLARIATEQDVNAIVSGTILTASGRLRVSAQLTEMPGATVKWSHSTETALDDIFGVQDELTRKIVRSLSGSIDESDSRALRHDVPRNAAAYEFFLRANQQAHVPQGWLIARDLYRRSIDEDPNFAPAWTRLGRTYWMISKYTSESGDYWKLAQDAFARAIALNPNLSLAQRYDAEMAIEDEHTMESLVRLAERVQMRPNDPDLRAALGKALRYCGLLRESLDAFGKARALDPQMPLSIVHTYFHLGEYQTAHDIHRDVHYMEPITLMMLGRTAEAEQHVRATLSSNPDPQYRAYYESLLGTLTGDYAAASRAIDTIANHQRDPEALFYMARNYARIGEADKALDLLQRVSRSFFPVFTLEHDPWLEFVRGLPRFADVMRLARESHDEARRAFARSVAK